MTVISQADQELVRSLSQRTQLYLSIYQPDTILACQVNNVSAAKGDRTITFDSVTSGSYLNINAGMTLMVGTAAGLDDRGRVRVRSATSSTLLVAENSHINWADDLYLTVIDFYEINAVYPRITQNQTDVDFFKDYDIVYTNQNTVRGSLISMGGHYAGFTDDDVYYSASGTIHVGGDTLSYHWNFDGGTPSGSSSRDPGYISYSTPGHYTTSLTVSGTSTGAIDTSYRHVSIYDRPENGTNTPILRWELEQLTGSRGKGGWVAKVIIREVGMGDSVIKAGSLVTIFGDTWYETNRHFIGGNDENRGSVLFSGYVLKGSVEYDYATSTVTFEVGSVTEIMKEAEGFSISVEDSTDPAGEAASNNNYPSGWVLLKDMNVKTALYHYLRWHTTVLNCADVRWVGDDRAIQYFDSDRTSIYDALRTLMAGTLWGEVVADRQGAVYLEAPIWSSSESANFETNLPLSSQDFLYAVAIEDAEQDRLSFGEYGGIAYSGAQTGTWTAYLTVAPGDAPGYRGGVERSQGLALLSQDQLNILAGDNYAQKNVRYSSMVTSMAGGYLNFDIAPQEFIPVTVNPDDNNRGVSFQEKNFYLKNMSFNFRPSVNVLNSTLTMEEIQTNGFPGDTIPVPDVPTESETGGGFNVPAFGIPPIGGFNLTVEGGAALDRIFCKAIRGWDVGAGSELTWSGADYITVADSATAQFDHFFSVPIGCTSFTAYALLNIRTTTSGVCALAYGFRSGLVQFTGADDIRSVISSDNNVTIPASSFSKWIFSDAMIVDVGDASDDTRVGDAVRFRITIDRSADPPDTLAGNMGYMGLYVVFSFA